MFLLSGSVYVLAVSFPLFPAILEWLLKSTN